MEHTEVLNPWKQQRSIIKFLSLLEFYCTYLVVQCTQTKIAVRLPIGNKTNSTIPKQRTYNDNECDFVWLPLISTPTNCTSVCDSTNIQVSLTLFFFFFSSLVWIMSITFIIDFRLKLKLLSNWTLISHYHFSETLLPASMHFYIVW